MKPTELAPPNLPCPITNVLDEPKVVQHFLRQTQPVDAVPTPFTSWNEHCRDDGGGVGLGRGWHVTVAANTGNGKSLLALNMAATAIGAGEQVGFVSLEMSRDQVASRLISILSGSDVRDLERGSFCRREADLAEAAIAEIRERTGGTFWMNERPIYDIKKITGLMRYLREEKDCRYFVLDYLQLAAATDADNLYAQVSNVSAQVRELAKTLNVITVGLSQFNRSTSANYSNSPTIQGLMGASSIENDSDCVLLLDSTRWKKGNREARTWAILGKNRHGGTGEFPILWDYRTLRVREVLPNEEDEWP